jgi:hypothetical protein
MTGAGDNMETTIKASIKKGKYPRSLSEMIKEVSEKLSTFVINKKLSEKEIEFRGYIFNKKEQSLEVKYEFINKGPLKFKGITMGLKKGKRDAKS